jgi:hypothetical protein
MSRGYKSEGSGEGKRGIPVFGADIGASMTKGLFFVSERESEEGPIYEGTAIDLVILGQISTSEEQERNIRSSADGARKTLRAAALARWPVKGEAGITLSEWAPATITLRGSAQGLMICALRIVRKAANGNDAGIAFRISTAGVKTKAVGQGTNRATIIDADACRYTVLPSDPEISEELAAGAGRWFEELKLLRDGAGAGAGSSRPASSPAGEPPPWDDADIPF